MGERWLGAKEGCEEATSAAKDGEGGSLSQRERRGPSHKARHPPPVDGWGGPVARPEEGAGPVAQGATPAACGWCIWGRGRTGGCGAGGVVGGLDTIWLRVLSCGGYYGYIRMAGSRPNREELTR